MEIMLKKVKNKLNNVKNKYWTEITGKGEKLQEIKRMSDRE